MIFTKTDLPGVYIIDIKRKENPRGFFALVAWLMSSLSWLLAFSRFRPASHGISARHSARPATRRRRAEAKIVRCTAGAIYEVRLTGVRKFSSTCGRWIGLELSAANRRSLFVPEGIAQGYQTLVDDTEVYYQMTTRYHPEAARGVRWDDPMLAIDWPLPTIAVVSDADRAQPTFAAATGG